ncbi:hypothetical protein AKJ09_07169 [Labilithrix luteola]|uniref:Lipoprotein n=1 Tax=Labilithrix luteola TaxID=1391654 RepID=A0A0K1Q3U4_9BACT|nr:hypothetical protein [Labilithrix luteola]AKV00506.1 hypothetical protein AKJ09_07169 [Labilithrix luteola]
MVTTRFGWRSALVCLPLLACTSSESNGSSVTDAGATNGEDASTPSTDSGAKPDASEPIKDAGASDAGASDGEAEAPMTCTGSGELAITGKYVEADGTQHWLTKTATATTYVRVPSGAADNTRPPTLWKITRVCSNEKAFLVASPTGTFARVEWMQDTKGLSLCVAATEMADENAALSAPKSAPITATGCKGAAWALVTTKAGAK